MSNLIYVGEELTDDGIWEVMKAFYDKDAAYKWAEEDEVNRIITTVEVE